MHIDFKKLHMSEQSVKKRLTYVRGQIEKCEGEIPSKLWCKDCKDRIKKIKHLLDKLSEVKERRHLTTNTSSFNSIFGPASVYDDDNYAVDDLAQPNIYVPRYVCSGCKKTFERKEDLVYNDYDGRWGCPECDSDKIVVITYNINSKRYVERDLNDGDDEVSTTSNLYQYVCLDCGAECANRVDLSKVWHLDKNKWACSKCRSFNIVYVDHDGREQRLNED